MNALKADTVTAVDELRSRRHRAVSGSIQVTSVTQVERPTAAFDDEDRDASSIIAMLADAIERIAETTTDAGARAIAEDALILFQGR